MSWRTQSRMVHPGSSPWIRAAFIRCCITRSATCMKRPASASAFYGPASGNDQAPDGVPANAGLVAPDHTALNESARIYADGGLARFVNAYVDGEGVRTLGTMNMVILGGRPLFMCDTYVNFDPSPEQLAELTLLAVDDGLVDDGDALPMPVPQLGKDGPAALETGDGVIQAPGAQAGLADIVERDGFTAAM